MRPKKHQIINLNSVQINDPHKNRTLTLLVKEDQWVAFKATTSFITKVELSSKIIDESGKTLKDQYKDNPAIELRITPVAA